LYICMMHVFCFSYILHVALKYVSQWCYFTTTTRGTERICMERYNNEMLSCTKARNTRVAQVP
jgi:hypothetical protein